MAARDPALPTPQWSTHRNTPRVRTVKPNGTTLGPSSVHRPRRPTRPTANMDSTNERRADPTDASVERELTNGGVTQLCFGLFSRAQPNGVRLSCGAERERSQTEDYLRERGAGSFRRLLGSAASRNPI